MKIPRNPLSKDARDHVRSKLDRMKGIERKKTIKRLEMYDRGFRKTNPDDRVEKEK